uniref:Uncharacterized protein n=1 Tax=uncultured marine thaumarchaeote SAT1000_05_G10 TaxID=1456358 RepID=A0A075I6V0_9ARCH|nr:hypothetical protein [uncultured marine thaumarchaeote SAT1000_05_G10]
MAAEKYIAIGSIALYTIFAAEMITLFNFMIQATEATFLEILQQKFYSLYQ